MVYVNIFLNINIYTFLDNIILNIIFGRKKCVRVGASLRDCLLLGVGSRLGCVSSHIYDEIYKDSVV